MTEENTTYQLEAFEIFLISVPRITRTVVYSIGVAGITALILWSAQYAGMGYEVVVDAVYVFAILFVPTVVGGEFIAALVPSYPRKWGYFLSLVNQLLAAAVIVVGALVPFVGVADVFWIAAGVMALNTLEVLIITTGFRELWRLVLSSLPQAAVFAGLLLVAMDANRPQLTGLFAFGSAIALVLLATAIAEGMVKVNVDVKGFDFSAALTQHTGLALGVGEVVRRPIQRLRIENEAERFEFLVPYFHPGLVSKIGGGRLSRRATEVASKAGVGSFLKPPTSHKSDPSAPEVVDEILDARPALSDEETATATRLVEVEAEELRFKARRYGDVNVIWFDSDRYDDVEFGAYEHVHDRETEIVVDCHANEPPVTRNLNAGTVEAERFREALADAVARVESEPQSAYEAGFAEVPGEIPGFALVERVDGETTLLLGFDANNISEEIRRLGRDLEERFDDVVLLTTDTHASPFRIHDQPRIENLQTAVDRARERMSLATTRFASGMVPPVSVYGDYYTKLIDSFNIAARFYIVSLGLIYVYLVAVVLSV